MFKLVGLLTVNTVILEQSKNFVLSYASQPNVMTFKTRAIVQEVHSALKQKKNPAVARVSNNIE